ncbi:hypothetical protein Ahy_B05g074706 [Arachis hypogaea]|uniref:Uncharacterized protein n=1 Tax=Arachis hypogaea TaxID=3818 RepID=A0A444YZL0_ARAHY|nr:hypothetical protein Ahy_B05g074706 [Arachis hypogaea]
METLICDRWFVTKRVHEGKNKETYNHNLIAPKYIQFVRAYRTMTDTDKAQVDSLHFYNVRICRIMGFMADNDSLLQEKLSLKDDKLDNFVRTNKSSISDY